LSKPTIKVVAVGLTQLLSLLIYFSAVTDTIEEQLLDKMFPKALYPAYILSSVLQTCYAVGVKDIFVNTYSQTHFWLEVFTLNGREAMTRPVYVFPNTMQNELNNHSNIIMKVPKIALLIRMMLSIELLGRHLPKPGLNQSRA
jgi:hypothetical protein